ncbi:MAG: HlyD family efflux transporter periplasmic adaptor subunit [Simkania sp.]|nr:HlyD family efflux transporter periplasmic adaptor subunit [Simkania sp.]
MSSPENVPLNKKRNFLTLVAVAFFLACGFAYLIYWIGWGRFEESTDDAYVNGNMIMLTPMVDGIVTSIWADNAQLVEPGQPIVELDRHDYEIAFERAKGHLAQTVREVTQLFLKVDELEASVEARKADLLRASLDFEHRQALVDDGSVSKEDYEHSETTLYAAYSLLNETQKKLEAAYAEIQGTTISSHPLVHQAQESLKFAFLELHRCSVLSPIRGIVTQRKVQLGERVQASDPLLSIVPLEEIWVDANFREVQLKNLRIGQPTLLTSDMYGSGVQFRGTVVGLNPGTGSVFSILPPQNATGNWIKIIQRIPVKISIDPEDLKQHPLVLGLSMDVTVDMHNTTGAQLPGLLMERPIYQTTIYDQELQGVDILIEQIIKKNSFDDSD